MVGKIGIKEAREAVIASLALFVIATTDKVVVAVVIIYICIITCSLLNAYYSSKLWGSLQNLYPTIIEQSVAQITSVYGYRISFILNPKSNFDSLSGE